MANENRDALPRTSCPGGVGFETSSASGGRGAVLVANLTRPGMTVPLSDETWQTEWSGGMGERSGAHIRHGELKELRQHDFNLGGEKPSVTVRASVSKNHKQACLPCCIRRW